MSKSGVYMFLAQWTRMGCQIATTVVLARVLSPDQFGVYALVAAVFGVATLVSDSGLSISTMQAKTLTDQQSSNIFWVTILIGFLMGSSVLLSADSIATFFGMQDALLGLQLIAIAVLLQAIYAQLSAQRLRQLEFRRVASIEITASLSGLAVGLVTAINGAGYMSLVWQQMSMVALQGLLVFLPPMPYRLKMPRRTPMGTIYSSALNTFGVQGLTYTSNNADAFAGAKWWNAVDLGEYSRALQLFRQPLQQLAGPLTKIVLPILSRRQDDREWLNDKLQLLQRTLVFGLGFVFAFLFINAPDVIEVLLGPGWEGVVLPFAILVAGGVFQTMGYVYYWAFIIRGQTGVQLLSSFLTRSLMIVLILMAAPFGPAWTAGAVSLGLALHWVLLTVWPMRHTGLDIVGLVRSAMGPLALWSLLCLLLLQLRGALDGDETGIVARMSLLLLAQCGLCVLAVFMTRRGRADLAFVHCVIWRKK